jgi:UDPglucose 6-dehydrogenase
MRVAVHGLWHLGCVTAACLAEAGFDVVGLDADGLVVSELQQGRPPLHEPGLAELITAGLASGRLIFTVDPAHALENADVLWVTFDTPVDENDCADVAVVRRQLDGVMPYLRPGTLVLLSSQVPVGFTGELERAWQNRGLRFACSPENLRLGKALDCFRHPERVVIGVRGVEDRVTLSTLFTPFCTRLEWMSIESAEMTKHALNAFLATSVTFINELARLCEVTGADAREVERGLKSESRIGPGAYLSPGAAFAGGTLARDVQFLSECGRRRGIATPLMSGVRASNDIHKHWLYETVQRLIGGIAQPIVAILGLAYKPGTSTLRRSAAVELSLQLHAQGAHVRVHDPAVNDLPTPLAESVEPCETVEEALDGADVLVVATPWPVYRSLIPDTIAHRMRRPQVIDPSHFLGEQLASDTRITYVSTGKVKLAA